MAEQVRYGLVGTGMMGIEHLTNLAVTPGAVVTMIPLLPSGLDSGDRVISDIVVI